MSDLESLIRTIPDYPKEGILFRDVTTLLADANGLKECVNKLAAPFKGKRIDYVAGIEARGFILGAAVALELGVGFIPIRKKGKLPGKVISQDYELEYGTDTLEISVDVIDSGSFILLVDDLIATGGTAEASIKLIQRVNSEVVAACFVIDLPDLAGSECLRGMDVEVVSLISYEGH